MTRQYDYESDAVRREDDQYAQRARELARDGIYTEARDYAGKLNHYRRSCALIDEVARKRRRERGAP